VVGVEQWAEVRRLSRVERLSIREISRRTGLHRKTVRRALAAAEPPRYARKTTGGSKVDPFKEWICEQLCWGSADPVAAVAGDGVGDRVWGREVDLR
jgi:transposase